MQMFSWKELFTKILFARMVQFIQALMCWKLATPLNDECEAG